MTPPRSPGDVARAFFGPGVPGHETAAFGRALARVRAGEDEDAAAIAERVDTGDLYALLDADDAARVAGP